MLDVKLENAENLGKLKGKLNAMDLLLVKSEEKFLAHCLFWWQKFCVFIVIY